MLEKYVDLGILFERMLEASKHSALTFHDGEIHISRGARFDPTKAIGTKGTDYTLDILELACRSAYEEAYRANL